MAAKTQTPRAVTALKVSQWLNQWKEVRFDPKYTQAKPKPFFYLFSMAASELKALTGVYRRSVKNGKPRATDPNVQRGHEEERSRQIREFVRFGFPWCEMGDAKRRVSGAEDLRQPGWLPTAIVVNILEAGSERNGRKIVDADLVRVTENGEAATLHLPTNFSGVDWEPKSVYPFEVIDGQHRLWAFEDFAPDGEFQLPVVAFHGLDIGWQAYLFWSVNITPKKINRSLAFDLYPLLRRASWLERFAGHSIYRETRCQELVESLWSHPESAWHHRINMLGETASQLGTKAAMVSQAAWIRSLMATFVKEWPTQGRLGGLFGAPRSLHEPILQWNRAMQSAFLITAGVAMREEIKNCKAEWTKHLRKLKDVTLFELEDDPAFFGQYSHIATDQGIRGLLSVINDLCFASSSDLKLKEWMWEEIAVKPKGTQASATDEDAVTAAISSLRKKKAIYQFICQIASGLASYDWRTSATPDLSSADRERKLVFRGSSGYKELRRQLLAHLASGTDGVAKSATDVLEILGY